MRVKSAEDLASIRRLAADFYRPKRDGGEQTQDQQKSDHSQFFGQNRNDKIVVRFGQMAALLHAAPQPHSEQPAVRERDERLRLLIADIVLMGERVDEGLDAIQPIRRPPHQRPSSREREREREKNITPTQPGQKQRRPGHADEKNNRAEIGLQRERQAQRQRHHKRGMNQIEADFARRRPPRAVVGQIHGERQFGELDRLQRKAENLNPTKAAAALDAQARQQRQPNRKNRQREQLARVAPPKMQRRAAGANRQRRAQTGVKQMPRKRPRQNVAVGRGDRIRNHRAQQKQAAARADNHRVDGGGGARFCAHRPSLPPAAAASRAAA